MTFARLLALPLLSLLALGHATAQSPDGATSHDAQVEDLKVFRRDFLDVDRSYSSAARVEAASRLQALETAAGPTDATVFAVDLCQIAALADNGHTTCKLPRANGVAMSLLPIDGAFYVIAASPQNSDLLGSRLAGIDGHPAAEVSSALRSLHGGVAAWRDIEATDAIVRPDLLHALGLANAAGDATFRFQTPDGRIIDRKLAPEPQRRDWVKIFPKGRAPWPLQDQEQPFRWRDAPELDGVVAEIRRNVDGKTGKIADFLAEVEAARVRLGRKNLVLDMRFNTGGNLMLTRDALSSWPSRVKPPGRLFVLESPITFSAGIVDVAYLKQAGGDRVTLVGEAPGDRMMFFADQQQVTLPHSGVVLQSATQRYDLQNGCKAYADCFVGMAQPSSATGTTPVLVATIDKGKGRKPVALKTLEPDIAAPWSIDDLLKGRDPGMAAVQAALAGQQE
ncbi:hypothetical protein EOA75_24065 [Mesorhizobium sp. M1A.F.Ca.IN.022.07.1.1]|uniref:hypothetical protein n=2 Tax=Mesorhizobium TaxID=68287 RepID=UPI000FCC2E2E|nr:MULTISPECIES: hypothetical protein [unclassified Mesorhizobium]RUV88784.1 hypothetical protein EOA75_24065 [Mesorhizobium sp. M1A.F.Ca.IN.022.07.1.1]RWG03475.1 MAG: hypothetical protein EOQ54_16665 [Mesorhizobium sp.]